MRKVTSLFLILLLVFGMFSCAKNVQQEDYSMTVKDSMQGLVVVSLRILDKDNPEISKLLYMQYEALLQIGDYYIDGDATIDDIADSIEIVLLQINDNTHYINDEADLVTYQTLYAVVSGIASTVFAEPEIPESYKPYIVAFIEGIRAGMTDYINDVGAK